MSPSIEESQLTFLSQAQRQHRTKETRQFVRGRTKTIQNHTKAFEEPWKVKAGTAGAQEQLRYVDEVPRNLTPVHSNRFVMSCC